MADIKSVHSAWRELGCGDVKLYGNSNTSVNGQNNQGVASNNSNIGVSSNNSILNLSKNSNLKVSVENAKLETTNCSNTDISGNKNEGWLKYNSNSKFSGNWNKWEASSNSNVALRGDNNIVKLVDNSNARLEVDRGKVTAEGNSNLKVFGDGNNIVVKGTRNHVIRPTSDDMKQINQLEIIPGMRNSESNNTGIFSVFSPKNFPRISSYFWNNNNSSSFKIDYVDEAVIEKHRYKLGIYNFTMENNFGTNYHQIRLDEKGLDNGSLVSQVIGPNEVLLSATKDGVKQELKLKGPQVTEADLAGKVFLIDMFNESTSK